MTYRTSYICNFHSSFTPFPHFPRSLTTPKLSLGPSSCIVQSQQNFYSYFILNVIPLSQLSRIVTESGPSRARSRCFTECRGISCKHNNVWSAACFNFGQLFLMRMRHDFKVYECLNCLFFNSYGSQNTFKGNRDIFRNFYYKPGTYGGKRGHNLKIRFSTDELPLIHTQVL